MLDRCGARPNAYPAVFSPGGNRPGQRSEQVAKKLAGGTARRAACFPKKAGLPGLFFKKNPRKYPNRKVANDPWQLCVSKHSEDCSRLLSTVKERLYKGMKAASSALVKKKIALFMEREAKMNTTKTRARKPLLWRDAFVESKMDAL